VVVKYRTALALSKSYPTLALPYKGRELDYRINNYIFILLCLILIKYTRIRPGVRFIDEINYYGWAVHPFLRKSKRNLVESVAVVDLQTSLGGAG
jgi:hypothetical protein